MRPLQRIGALLLVLVFAVGVSACESTTTTDQADSSEESAANNGSSSENADAEAEDAKAEDEPKRKPKKKKPKVAGVGDSITIEGAETKVKVTVTKVMDPLPTSEFMTPEDGMRYVGVRLTLSNVGDATYDDSPSNGAAIITNRDEQADPTITVDGPCKLQASIKIAPGSRRKVCIPFEVPKSQKAKTLQFTLDSGFGPKTGEWKLR